MPTDVFMPQMGESVAEGTIVRWLKQVGDAIDKDEPLFEVSTDKVDAEIPAPDAGVLLDIRVKEGDTVPVNSVVAVIGREEERQSVASHAVAVATASTVPAAAGAVIDRDAHAATSAGTSLDERRRTRSSPLVRRIAKEHGVDIRAIAGTGVSGRVTRRDLEAALAGGAAPAPAFAPGEDVRVEKMTVMRKKIAEHMVMSVRTSPHVYATYEVDFGRVDEIRRAHRASYEADGLKLTYTAFIAKAVADSLRDFPIVNASVDGDTIVYRRDINLGIAVALEQGLIVPVIRAADHCDLRTLCRTIQDLAQRARTKQLKTEEVQGGTFTITNPGMFGARSGLAIISQPQVAILAIGSIDKRVVVVDDMIAIRPTGEFTLGFDHRLIDGADGARFLAAVKRRLEHFDEALV
ncbi:MAG TPA: dihydrolipoamide acetyltransferase family protein [Vicinamibacterales bacterium]|jgi:2-oxoglutarate dehydrogenase E2 component (dihydrolipoamide succinyltransferase)|nr:dihydrolipoamide acetyltransferase family protein [Vicinamibacterales bacterium]